MSFYILQATCSRRCIQYFNIIYLSTYRVSLSIIYLQACIRCSHLYNLISAGSSSLTVAMGQQHDVHTLVAHSTNVWLICLCPVTCQHEAVFVDPLYPCTKTRQCASQNRDKTRFCQTRWSIPLSTISHQINYQATKDAREGRQQKAYVYMCVLLRAASSVRWIEVCFAIHTRTQQARKRFTPLLQMSQNADKSNTRHKKSRDMRSGREALRDFR